MKRHTLLLVILVLGVVSVVPAAAQDNGVVLQLTAPFFAEDILEPVIEEYEAAHPGVQVQLVISQGFGMPVANSDDPEEYQDNLAAYFSSADVLLVDSALTPEATRAGYVLDLSPLTSSDVGFDADSFYPALLSSYEWDGGQWALPISASFVLVSYIPEAFDAAGLAYPSESWTLDDLIFAAQSLTQYNADGTVALPGLFIQGNNNTLPALFLSATGNVVYSDATFPSSPDFSDPLLETSLDKWYALESDGLLDLPEGVNNNDVPIVIGNPQFGGGGGGGFFGNNQDVPERVAALLPGGRAGLNVNGYAISHGTLYPEESYDLVKFLINHPNAVSAVLGTVPAVQGLQSAAPNQGGGPGGGPFNNGAIPAILEPLLDSALAGSISVAEGRFSRGIVAALNLMQDEALDARTALDDVQNDFVTRLAAADNRATTSISVTAPTLPPVLAAGEIALDFATLGGGGPGGGFANQERWDNIAAQFVANDPEVRIVNIENENPNQLATVAQNYDCFYSGTNLVPDADLSLLLNLDPLVSIDPSFDPSDFIGGVFNQVKVNNQLWALPLQVSPLVLRFDSDVFNQAGVALPQEEWTVSEFQDTLNQLTFALTDDQMPLELNAAGQTSLLMLIAVYGGVPFDTRTDPPTINFTDPATVTAIQEVLDLARDGYLAYSNGQGGGNNQADSIPHVYSNVINAFSFGGFGGGPGGGGGGGNNAPSQNTDGIVPFPRGTQYNAVAFNLGTAYISASAENPEACYRFLSFLSQSTELFDSMPARYSQIDSPNLAAAQSEQTVAFYRELATLIDQQNTLVFSNNINAGNFGMTSWLFDVFDRYIAGEVVDLPADLQDAQQTTSAYLDCVTAIAPPDPTQDNIQGFFEQIQACQASVETGV